MNKEWRGLFCKTHLQTEPFSSIALDSQSPFVEGNYLFYNGESDTDTPIIRSAPRLVYLIEFLSYKDDLFSRNSGSIVSECEKYLSVAFDAFDAQNFSRACIFYEIREDVMEELDKFPLIKMKYERRFIC